MSNSNPKSANNFTIESLLQNPYQAVAKTSAYIPGSVSLTPFQEIGTSYLYTQAVRSLVPPVPHGHLPPFFELPGFPACYMSVCSKLGRHREVQESGENEKDTRKRKRRHSLDRSGNSNCSDREYVNQDSTHVVEDGNSSKRLAVEECGNSNSSSSPSTSSPPFPNSIKGKFNLKKARTSFTQLQIQSLEMKFDQQKYLARKDRSSLAHGLGLMEKDVKTWFQNRRTKWKKDCSEENWSKHKEIAAAMMHAQYMEIQ